MKMIRVLIVLAIVVVGLGFYRGWFTLSRATPVTGSGTESITLETDLDKMKQDAQTVKDKATGLTGGVTEGGKADGQANDTAMSNQP